MEEIMKRVFLAFARHNEEANKTITEILNGLSNDDREKDHQSYYGSLSGLYQHLLMGTSFFLGLYKEAVPDNAGAQKALEPLAKVEQFKGKLTGEQWKKVVSCLKIADKALVEFVSALKEKDYEAPVKLTWYNGNPPSVPLYFMFQQLTAHNIHHRGQISQILDSLKVDNNYSGINVQFLG
jgi:uncharacterized damage-inducible protein DinB